MQQKKVPMRMCLGCGEMFPKRELIRAVKNKEGEISLDLIGKAPGRGAYLCRNLQCLQKARKTRRLERAFSSKIPDALYDKMEAELSADAAAGGKAEHD